MNKFRTRFFFGLLNMLLVLLLIITNLFVLQLVWVLLFAMVQILLLFELFNEHRWSASSVYLFIVIIASFAYMLLYVLFLGTAKFEAFALGLVGIIFLGAVLTPMERPRKLVLKHSIPIPRKELPQDVEVVDLSDQGIEEIRPPQKPGENVFDRMGQEKVKQQQIKAELAREAVELEEASKQLDKVARKIRQRTKPKRKRSTAKKTTKKATKTAKKPASRKKSTTRKKK